MALAPRSDVVSVEHRNHIATVWLDRPDKRNALDGRFWRDFPVIVQSLGEDDDVRVVIVAGRGSAFTVGLDLEAFGPEFASGGSSGSPVLNRRDLYSLVKRMQRTFSSLAECPKPVIAAVHGYCIGAGIDLITAADIRLASPDAVFSVRETRLAIVPDVGTLQRLPRIVEPGRVADLVYTGRDFDAAEALAIGLVSELSTDAEDAMPAAIRLATQIAENSPLAVQGAKAVLRAGDGRTVDEALDYVALWNAAFLHSNDLTEAIEAFAERRSPRFEGR